MPEELIVEVLAYAGCCHLLYALVSKSWYRAFRRQYPPYSLSRHAIRTLVLRSSRNLPI